MPNQIVKRWIVLPRPHLYSKFTAELLACAMFHFVGSVSPTPWTNAIALMGLVFFSAKTSNAILNPALTLTFCLLGHTNPIEVVVYWSAQVGGCILGALWIALLVPSLRVGDAIARYDGEDHHDGCFIPRRDLGRAEVFGWEATGSFVFFSIVMTVVYYSVRKKGYGNVGPIMVGLALLANALAIGPFTGGAMNPARVLGSFAVFRCGNDEYVWYYIAGELLAALMVPLVIAPWYGICTDSWYLDWLPSRVRTQMKYFQPSLRINELSQLQPNGTHPMNSACDDKA